MTNDEYRKILHRQRVMLGKISPRDRGYRKRTVAMVAAILSTPTFFYAASAEDKAGVLVDELLDMDQKIGPR